MALDGNLPYSTLQNISEMNCSGLNEYGMNINGSLWDELHASDIFIHYLFTIIVPICFAILIVAGTFGNSLVIYVIVTNKQMITCTNILLINLAIADIAFLVICVPFQAHKYASSSWLFNDVTCKLIQYLLYVTCYVTIWTLVLIAIIRYYTLVYKTSSNSRKRSCVCVRRTITLCFVLWTVNFILHIPTLLSHSIKSLYDYEYCGIADWSLRSIIISFFICAYALPLIITTLLYLRIIYYLRGVQLPSHRRHIVRAIRIISLVVLFFAISWLPYHIHALVSLNGVVQWDYYQVFRIIWYCMAYGNSVVNPIIYNFTCVEFRSAFHEALCRCCIKNRSPYGSRTENGKILDTEMENVVQL